MIQMILWLLVLMLSVPVLAEDKGKPVPADLKVHVLEAKSEFDDAQLEHKNLDTQVDALSKQIKQRYDAIQKQEDEAKQKYEKVINDTIKGAGLDPAEWLIDTKTWTFTKKPPAPAPPSQPAK
jgi:hypothetical protein